MHLKTVAIIAVVALVFVGLTWMRNAGASEAKKKLAEGAFLVDVRTPSEFAAGHLPNAINIPVDQVGQRLKEFGAKDRPIVVYCRSGARSSNAASTLKSAGFQQVYNLGAMSNGQ